MGHNIFQYLINSGNSHDLVSQSRLEQMDRSAKFNRACVCLFTAYWSSVYVPHYLSVVFHQTLQVGLVSGMVFLPFGQVLQAVKTDGPPTIRNHTLQLDTSLLELELFEYTSMHSF